MTALRIALSVVAAALGVGALVLAHDMHAWRDAVSHGDAGFATHPASARWEAATWLPQGAALRALGLRDDLRLRHAEKAFAVVEKAPRGFDGGRHEAENRAAAEVALADLVTAGSPPQASRAGNLLGILAATATDQADPSEGEQRAASTFDAAIRADTDNADAKHNLELLLRRIKVIGSRQGEGGTSSDYHGRALGGAGAGRPGSGY